MLKIARLELLLNSKRKLTSASSAASDRREWGLHRIKLEEGNHVSFLGSQAPEE